MQKLENKLHYSVIGNLDYDAGCWRCHPTTSADCFKYKDIYCHPRAIAKTGNDDFTSKKVSLENVISWYEYFETKSQRFMSQKCTIITYNERIQLLEYSKNCNLQNRYAWNRIEYMSQTKVQSHCQIQSLVSQCKIFNLMWFTYSQSSLHFISCGICSGLGGLDMLH